MRVPHRQHGICTVVEGWPAVAIGVAGSRRARYVVGTSYVMLVVSLMAAWQGWSHGAHGLGRSVVPQTAQTSLPRRAKMHTSFEASSNPDACSEFFPPRVCLPSAGLTQQFRFCSAKLAENTFATSDECWVRTDTSKIGCQRRYFHVPMPRRSRRRRALCRHIDSQLVQSSAS